HALEMSRDAEALLREAWRVLAAGGRLLAVIPNRRGVWARTDTTPFGHGRPYSRSQITHLLRETWFTPISWGEALYVPPIARNWFLRTAVAWERTGSAISAPFSGVHIFEATKQVYRALPARRERQRLVPALEPALAPSPTMQWESVRLIFVAIRAVSLMRLLLWLTTAAGDEGRQSIDVAAILTGGLTGLLLTIVMLLLLAVTKGGLRLAHRIGLAL